MTGKKVSARIFRRSQTFIPASKHAAAPDLSALLKKNIIKNKQGP